MPILDAQLPIYRTSLGEAYVGDALDLLRQLPDSSVDLVITSPPFPLKRPKEYGNLVGEEYEHWLVRIAAEVFRVLKDTGSFVIDLGGTYLKGRPVRSLYNFKLLIRFVEELGFSLAEEFYWFNPSKLPSPIEWVNKRKIRVKDSVNTVWWLSKTDFPKANVTRVLTPYSKRMQKLLSAPNKYYSAAKRPSGHSIGDAFGKGNGGAIPPNLLIIPNSESNSFYIRACRELGIKPHPARFPSLLPEFFIRFLTDPEDLVLDIFAGSNTTGAIAEGLSRRWLAFDLSKEYLAASAFRFAPRHTKASDLHRVYHSLLNDPTASLLLPDSFLGRNADTLFSHGAHPTRTPE